MENNSPAPLLSICIPTYNRAEYLREALENITSDPAFDDKVEVVISDNASTDHTQTVGEEYACKYKNVHYYRNPENVRDANFKLVLSRANGLYLKLSNDTLRYRSGTIGIMVREIEQASTDTPLFFYKEILFCKSDKQVLIDDINSLINHVSYFIGWIGNFGLWKSDLDCLDVPSRYTNLQFVQVAWTLEILKKHNAASIYFGDFYYSHEPENKGGYNLFKVQISNLFKILRDYGLKGYSYELAKYRIFRYHALPLFYSFVLLKNETGFDLTDSWKTIFKEYWYRPYMYPGILIAKIKCILTKSNEK